MASSRVITQWASPDGKFRRSSSVFRHWISPDGRFPPERNRYHLYVSLACPWAHRTLIFLKLKNLDSIIGTSVVHPHMGPEGWSWTCPPEYAPWVIGVTPDSNFKAHHLREIYFKAEPKYDGRFTVPVLFDCKNQTIVNNESSEIIRMLNSSFNGLLDEPDAKIDMYPSHLRNQIDELNEWIYDKVNNGVYKAGFATNQDAYLEAVIELFEALDKLESRLEGQTYLVGNQLTEADVRLYPTLIRFDPVYVSHFKCNIKTIRHGYPSLHRWLRDLYYSNENLAFRSTTDFEHIKCHYFTSHPQINPTRIIPQGPSPNIMPA